MKVQFLLLLLVLVHTFPTEEKSKRVEISPFSKSPELVGCGAELGQAFNYFDICTQQHPTDIVVTA